MMKNKVLEWLDTTQGAKFCASVLSARKDRADIDATLAGRPPKDSIWPNVIGDPSAPSEYWSNIRSKMLFAIDEMLNLSHVVFRAAIGAKLTAAEIETIENLIRSGDDGCH